MHRAPQPKKKLTPREHMAAYLVATGHQDKLAAIAMRLSQRGFRFHIDNVYRKLAWRRWEVIQLYAVTYPDEFDRLEKEGVP